MSASNGSGIPALTIDRVRTVREGRDVLAGVSLTVPSGQVWALMGISGAGKSTLLRSVAALESFDDGSITVDGSVQLRPGRTPPERALRALRSRVGFVFQQHALFAHLSVLDNVMLAPMHTRRQSRTEASARAMTLLDQLGVSHRAHARPGQISGGEAQRVAIARALALDPHVLLMDEPTAALDPARRSAMAESLRALASEGRTLLITTHDIDFARAVSDSIAVLAHGTVVETGPTARVLAQPAHAATQTLLAGSAIHQHRVMPLRTARALVGRERSYRADRQLGWSLAFVAGAINAGGFLAVGRYTSHVTGAVSSAADHLVLGQRQLAFIALGAVMAFLAGAITCAVMVNFAHRRHLSSAFALPLLLEALLILLFGVAGSSLSRETALLLPATVLLLSFLMGLQNAVVSKLSGRVIRTTHMTGIVTDLGIELGKWLYWNRSHHRGPDVQADSERLRVLSGLLVAFFVGGIVGAYGFKVVGYAFTIPIATVLLLVGGVPLIDDIRLRNNFDADQRG